MPVAMDSLGLPFAAAIAVGVLIYLGFVLVVARVCALNDRQASPTPPSPMADFMVERQQAEARGRAAAMRSRGRREAAYKTERSA